jgi:SAM-dependent methyltransferase
MTLSERYDTFYKSSLIRETFADVELTGWPQNRVEAILAYAGQGESVLDVGCGGGHLLYQLRHRFRRLVGLEFSGHRLEQAKINLADLPFVAIRGTAESMTDIPTGSVECVVSADTNEHVPDVYLAAAELFRVVQSGGKLIINTPNIAFAKKRALLLLGRFPSTSQPNEGFGSDVLFDGGHLHYFTFRSLSLLLQRAGFKIEQAVGYGKLGRLHHLYPPLLSGGVQLVARKPV